jgi:hypothetical protein
MNNSEYKISKKSFSFTVLIILLTVSIPLTSEAQRSGFNINSNNVDAEFMPRISHHEAPYAMTTQEGSVDLMIIDDAILIQFTDRFLQYIGDDIQEEKSRGESNHLKSVILSMVSTGVTSLLDRAMVIPLYQIHEVYYQNGKLYLIGYDGTELFEDLEFDGHYVMEDFSRRDARNFVGEIEKRMH